MAFPLLPLTTATQSGGQIESEIVAVIQYCVKQGQPRTYPSLSLPSSSSLFLSTSSSHSLSLSLPPTLSPHPLHPPSPTLPSSPHLIHSECQLLLQAGHRRVGPLLLSRELFLHHVQLLLLQEALGLQLRGEGGGGKGRREEKRGKWMESVARLHIRGINQRDNTHLIPPYTTHYITMLCTNVGTFAHHAHHTHTYVRRWLSAC